MVAQIDGQKHIAEGNNIRKIITAFLETTSNLKEVIIMDDDPALNYILYEEMEKEEKNPQKNGGCLGVFVLLLLPLSTVASWIIR